MRPLYRNSIVFGVFAFVALCGVLLSLSTPYLPSDDEMVYLTGALQARDHNLPDAQMLAGYDYGPYLYPKIMLAWYDTLGYYAFKSIFLVLLILTIGIAGYVLMRMLGLPWIPALLMSLVMLMPRFTAGTEIWGVFTFHEAIGRSAALPLFLLATGFLIARMIQGKSLWPVYLVSGLFLFLHPVTVMLFGFVCLVSVAVVRLNERISFFATIKELLACGIVFFIAGSYFYIDVLQRLSQSTINTGVSAAQYVQAVLFRNPWEFPAESLLWFRHTAIVSALFVLILFCFYFLPAARPIRERYRLPHARTILMWGIAASATSVICTFLFPGLNLYFMEHANAPYIFQQWSRLAKFFYLGLFVALVPTLYALWHWYLESAWRWKHAALVLLVAAGLASSSFGFEVSQFVIGYKNYLPDYIPQALSHIPDATTPAQYQAVCAALSQLGATSSTIIINGDFAFRYYCKAHLYVTNEEGGAYTQLPRADMVAWYNRLMAQRAALASNNSQTILSFARQIGAGFIILPLGQSSAVFEQPPYNATSTTRYVVVQVNK